MSVLKKEWNVEGECAGGTKAVPSCVQKPVISGTPRPFPCFRSESGGWGIRPPGPSMTGWKGQVTGAAWASQTFFAAAVRSASGTERSLERGGEVGGMERAERSSVKWASWRGWWGFRTARAVGAPDSRIAFVKGGLERRWWPI